MPGDLLVLDRLGLREDHRGHGLGLAVIVETVRQIGSSCAVIAMMPCALRYDATDSTFEVINERAGTKRLDAYYRWLGFRKLRNLLYFDNSLRMSVSPARTPRGPRARR